MKTATLDIDNLLTIVSTDDRKAFDLFYNLYYEQVFRVSYYFLRDKEACREVVTDVFFAVWQSRKKLRDITNIEAYLYVITRNEAIRYLSSNRNFSYISLDDLPMQLEERRDESPEDRIVTQEMESLLTQVVNELPEKCRLIFLMSREEGLKPKEIAEILSITESTVRVQMKIAIDKITNGLKPHYPDMSFTLLLAAIL